MYNIQQNENQDKNKLPEKMFYRELKRVKTNLYNLTKDILLTEEYIS